MVKIELFEVDHVRSLTGPRLEMLPDNIDILLVDPISILRYQAQPCTFLLSSEIS